MPTTVDQVASAHRLAASALSALLATLLSGCPPTDEPPARPAGSIVEVTVKTDHVVATVDERFLSFAVDASQVVGGDFWDPVGGFEAPTAPYDFQREKLRGLARGLGPAMLRIGGTEADELYADLTSSPVAEAPPPFAHVLTAGMLDGVCAFASDLGLEVIWTLNAGPGTRDEAGAWTTIEARKVITYLRDIACPVRVWELGNEINGFSVMHGAAVSGEQYAVDMAVARDLVRELTPAVLLAGPSSAFWPVIGEFSPVLPAFLREGGELVDVVTWHYYPQQSSRCPVASRQASPTLLLSPAHLDEVALWAGEVERYVAAHAPDAEIYLGETGHAQCGGEIGVSGTFVSVFWWLDELGQIARRGQPVVVRQTLSGADYQLVNDATLEPTPDYWASLLHKRLMGQRVLFASPDEEPSLRTYAHCGPTPGSVSVVVLNLDEERDLVASFPGLGDARELYLLDASDLFGTTVELNGAPLVAPDDGAVGALVGEMAEASGGEAPQASLPPTSAAFVHFPDADAPACR